MWLSSSSQRVLSQLQQGLRPPMHLERRGFLDQSTQHKRALAFIQTELVPGLLHIIFTGRTCMNENAGDDTEVECFDSPGSGESSRPPIPCPEGVLEERACLKSEPVLTQLL